MTLSLLRLEPRETPASLIINAPFAEQFALGGVGPGATGRLVRVQADGALATDLSVVPYPGFGGEVRVARGDVTGDGRTDLITAAGPGGGPHVKVFDGGSGLEVRSFMAYSPDFLGGVFLSAGDFTGDGIADILTGAGAGGGPHVRVFNGADTAPYTGFFAFDQRFTGGVSVAAGDVNADGVADIAVGAGPGGGPHVKVFSGFDLDLFQSFMAFDPTSRRGVNVAFGDVSGDSRADLVTTSAGPQPPPARQLQLVSAGPNSSTATTTGAVFITQNPFAPSRFTRTLDVFAGSFTGGVRVGTADVDGDGRSDVLFATGPGGSTLRVELGRDLTAGTLAGLPVFVDTRQAGDGLWVG
jgi:hypothetical protein